ncbi:MAG: hypothetical protein NTX33_19930 [Propionibacteriales bacterium]|nr:hypothetical protein [Propionibacteriales bacterium]
MTDWRKAQGLDALEALRESRRRQQAREDFEALKAEGGFDYDLLYGPPSYGAQPSEAPIEPTA